MNVILLRDVPGLGQRGANVRVADGYGRNYLMPRGLAVPATPGNLKAAALRQADLERRAARLQAVAGDLAGRLDGQRLEIPARVGKDGRLFGSVTARDIAERLGALAGEPIDRRLVDLPEPLRRVGEWRVEVRLSPSVSAWVTVAVVPAQ